MNARVTLLTAALFSLAACDGEKVQEAKKESAEAAKSIGEAAKEMGGKAMEKTKEATHSVGEKLKNLKDKMGEKGGPALESFKTKMSGLSEWFANSKEKAGEDPEKANHMMSELMAKMNAIQTEGIPDDLKAAFKRYQGVMKQLRDVTSTIPKESSQMDAWTQANADKLHAIEKESLEATKQLKQAAANHGLTGLDLGE